MSDSAFGLFGLTRNPKFVVGQAQLLLAALASRFGYDPNQQATYNTKYRNPVLSYLSAERLQIIYANAGLDAVAAEIAKLKTMGII